MHDLLMIFHGSSKFFAFRLFVLLTFFLGVAEAAFAQAANIVFTTGNATVIATDGSSRRAERGTVLEAGETVDTGEGRAQLKFRDGATISLQPGTQFRVEAFRFAGQDGRADEEDKVVMRFIKGALRAVSGLIGKEKRQQYRMDTVVGTIGIRGTEYGATMGDGGLAVTTYTGQVEVCNTAGCVLVGPGQTAVTPGSDTKPRLQPGSNLPGLMPGSAVPQLPEATPTNLPIAPPQQQGPATNTYNPSPTTSPVRGPLN